MKYQILEEPRENRIPYLFFTKKEISNYFKWFMKIKDERLKILISHVLSNETDLFTFENIQKLHDFMKEYNNTRPKTIQEINAESERIPKKLESSYTISISVFDELTYSIAFDIGVYLSEYFIIEFPDLKWDMEKRESLEYGRPVLKGKQKYFCPSVVMDTMLGRTNKQIVRPNDLLHTFKTYYDAWKTGREKTLEEMLGRK